MALLAQHGLFEATRETLRHVAHPHIFAIMFASHIRDGVRSMSGLLRELSEVWETLSPDAISS